MAAGLCSFKQKYNFFNFRVQFLFFVYDNLWIITWLSNGEWYAYMICIIKGFFGDIWQYHKWRGFGQGGYL